MSLKRIRLELARTPDFPEGSPAHGYEFVAPLDTRGHLNSSEWPQAKGACTVRRFWSNQPDEHGALIHRRNGSWASPTRRATMTTSRSSVSIVISSSRASTSR